MLSKCKRFLSLLCAIVILIGTYGAYLIPIQSIVSAAQSNVLDLDDDVKYFGRTFYEYDASGKKVYKFSWANSGFQFSFKGKGAQITLYGYSSDEYYDSKYVVRLWPRIKVYINGELANPANIEFKLPDRYTSDSTVYNEVQKKLARQDGLEANPAQFDDKSDSVFTLGPVNKNIETDGNKNILTISGLKEGNYTVKIVKCSDATYNGVGLGGITLLDVVDIKGEILTTQKYYDRQMLFLGGSLVSGTGNLYNREEAYGRDQFDKAQGNLIDGLFEDTTLSYTAITADAFGAENMTVSQYSRGLVYGFKGTTNSAVTTSPAKDLFEMQDGWGPFNKKSEVYDHTQYDPDVIVINYGSEDFDSGLITETDFGNAYKDFIMQVYAAYPKAKILCVHEENYGFASKIKNIVDELNRNGYAEIFFVALSTFGTKYDGTGDLIKTDTSKGKLNKARLLNASAHKARAEELIRVVEDITDWKGKDSVSNPVSDDMPVDTIYGPVEDTDVSLMSINVMQENSSGQTYLEPSKRAPLTVRFIKSYMPDIICLQEASTESGVLNIDGYGATNWAEYLTFELEKVGYECLLLTETVTNKDGKKKDGSNYTLNDMEIGRGLIICWKANRFTSDGSGRTRFVPDSFGSAQHQDRYWQWVQLQDNDNLLTSFRVYNTHIYNYPVSDSTKKADADLVSERMLEALSAEINTNMSKQPVLIAGDFVKTYDNSKKTENEAKKEYNYVYNFEKIAFIEDAMRTAYYTRLADPNATPNHIFYNKNYIDMREVHELYDGVEGRLLTSQEPIIAHFNFRCAVSFDRGLLNNDKTIFTDTVNGGTYSFKLTIPEGVTCGFFYEDGQKLFDNIKGEKKGYGVTITLKNKEVTRIYMRCNYNTSSRVNVIALYITRTDSAITDARPDVWATNTVNSYFANGAYHLLAGNHIVRVSALRGELYMNPYATIPVTNFTMNLKQGRTVLYVKSAATGEVYPVYIYRQTHTQAIEKSSESTIYVDDDFISNGTGKVAFFDGERVIFVDALSAFTTVEAAAAKANADGKLTTIYFGSGNYYVNQNYGSTPVKFTDDVILLGSNYDISAVDEQANQWFAAGRKSESIIHGGFYFEKNGNISVAVKGFKFQGQSGDGTIRINDLSSDLKTVMTHTQTVDIQNNIFMGSIDITNKETGRGQIWANSQAQVTGLIKDNYFRCVQDNTQKRNTASENNNHRYNTVAAYFNNLNDLLIERNCFVGYEICLYTQDVKQADNLTTSTSFTVYANRFDHCGANSNYLYGVGANDKTYICYRDNDFIRCGSGGASVKHSIDLYFNESSQGNLPGKVFGNITVDITGNRFAENEHALRLTRGKFDEEDFTKQPVLKEFKYYDYTDMVFNFTKNAIINPLERHYVKGYFYSIDIAGYPNVDASNQIVSGTVAAKSDKWAFSSNYCYSPFFDSGSDYWESVSDTDTDELKLYQYGLYDVRKYIRATRVTFADEIIKSNIHAYTTAAEAFKGAVGSYEDGWIYDFDHVSLPDTFDKAAKLGYEYDYIADIADMDFLRGVTSLRDKMTALDAPAVPESSYELKKIKEHSMLTTEHLTGEMRGQTSFYSDVRWYCKNRVSFDIRTTYTGDEATFFYKYSNGAMPTGDTYANISNKMFYTINSDGRSSSVNGILLKFKTVNKVATIEMHVSYNSGGSLAWREVSFTDIVDDLTEFIHIDIIEKEIGTMDFYVDGIHFARVIGTADDEYSFESGSIANTTNTADNAYYDMVNVYRVTNDVISTTAAATVSNSLVAKQTAIAFSSAHKAAADTANKLWPTKLSMEIDVLEVVDLGVGKLTIINHVAEGILYKAWNMTDCHYDEETKTYTYTVNEEWEDFFTSEQYREVTSKVFGTESLEDGKILLTLDRGENNNPVEHDNEFMIALSKAAVAYALEKGIEPVGAAKTKPIVPQNPEKPKEKYKAEIPIDGPGYYIVNSTLGSLITTDTFDNKDGTYNLTVYEKNDPPSIEKYVWEDNPGNPGWKTVNDAALNESVKFKLLITVQDGAYGYTIEDVIGKSFFATEEFLKIESVKRYEIYDRNSDTNVAVETFVKNTHYTVAISNDNLTIKFASAADGENAVGSLENVPSGNIIEVIYTVPVSRDAKIEKSNTTYATLYYGRIDDDSSLPEELRVTKQYETEEAIVNTYNWSIELYKFDKDTNQPLQGAQFELYTDPECTQQVIFRQWYNSPGNYRLWTAPDVNNKDYVLKSDSDGRYTIDGLDSGVYYLVEKTAPAGYAKMQSAEMIVIDATYATDVTKTVQPYQSYTVNGKTFDAFGIANEAAGIELPSTGAAGRRLFIATGSVIVLSMSILLVTRMRSSKVIFIKTETNFKVR